jgi:hypothetical protein
VEGRGGPPWEAAEAWGGKRKEIVHPTHEQTIHIPRFRLAGVEGKTWWTGVIRVSLRRLDPEVKNDTDARTETNTNPGDLERRGVFESAVATSPGSVVASDVRLVGNAKPLTGAYEGPLGTAVDGCAGAESVTS